MSGALNSVFSEVGNLVGGAVGGAIGQAVGGIAGTVLGAVFPPAAIAGAAMNIVSGAVGQALGGAVDSLVKESGMPSFLQGPIGDLIKSVIGEATGHGEGVSDCQHQIGDIAHEDIKKFTDDIAKSICQHALQGFEDEESGAGGAKGKGKGSESWLIALAKAMGQISGKHADKLNELSQKMDQAAGGNGGNGGTEFSQAQSEFQAESQLFGMLQSAFTNVLKSLGEGLTQMARKG